MKCKKKNYSTFKFVIIFFQILAQDYVKDKYKCFCLVKM